MRFRTITIHIAGDRRKYTAEPPIRDHSKFVDLVFGYENPPFGSLSKRDPDTSSSWKQERIKLYDSLSSLDGREFIACNF